MTLEPRSINTFKGLRFRIPSYQRGYRWEPQQVIQLLEDIADNPNNTSYYLQPIVVAPSPSEDSYDYDIIDGQQRVTTIYLILQALSAAKNIDSTKIAELSAAGNIDEILKLTALVSPLQSSNVKPDFIITYQTRASSMDFLCDIITQYFGKF